MSIKKIVLDMIHAEAEAIAEGKSMKPASKGQVAVVYQSTWTILRKIIMEHDGYRIAGFGTFARKTHAPSKGRNPQTGEPVDVPEYDTIHFAPTEDFKRALNQKLSKKRLTKN
jgi:DNA-binding protein HU-beta